MIQVSFIQYGTSNVYPISSMGNHVSAVPNHQTFRSVPLNTRAVCAYFGAFGYEMDLKLLTEEEQEQVKEQVRFVKENRKFLHTGIFYRLRSPFEENEAAWMVVSEDRKRALVAVFRCRQPVNRGYDRLRLAGLCPEWEYTISDRDYRCFGDELMEAGLILSDRASGVRWSEDVQGDDTARMIWVECKDT